MRIIRTEKQKDNLAKLFWDMGKVIFAVLVIGPFAKPAVIGVGSIISGLSVGLLSWTLGFIIDGMEVR